MTRQETYVVALSSFSGNKCTALELATGYGKTKLSIDLVNTLCIKKPNLKILLLVAKTVHKQNWLDEINKWGGFKNTPILIIECYESLKKHAGETFDIVIADEAHHLKSELRQDLFKSLIVNDKILLLSATFPKPLKQWLRYFFHTSFVSASLQDAIDDEVLPEPQIILFPLILDNTKETETIEVNPKAKGYIHIGRYATNYWNFKKQRVHAKLSATKKQYLQWLNQEILYRKNTWERTHFEGIKFSWLQLCNQRLAYLANCKNDVVFKMLSLLQDKRTLTFCKSIEQTEVLGKYCIHSKNGKAEYYLQQFNNKQIKHITACQMLNEGVNLTDCEYCIFANLNASELVSIQRIGRALRHKHPKIIIPYYVNTREQEIVEKMIEDYDKSLIRKSFSLNDLLVL